MRHDRLAQRPASVFSGPERWRLLTGILMLIVLGMLIARTGDPRNWRWLAGGKAAEPKAAAPVPKVPEPTGPTDEAPEQADAAREEYQAVTDGTSGLGREEMEAYNRLVAWADNQSFARLWQRAKKDLWYTDLYDAPRKHRGELIALDIEIGRAQSVDKNRDGIPLCEVWGATEESRGRLYDLIVVGYPKDMPIGYDIRREYGKIRGKFAGYFLKLQAYESGLAKPGQRPEKAPLLIGRLEWTPQSAPLVDNTQELIWGAVLLAVVALGIIVWFLFLKPNRQARAAPPRVVASSSGEAMPIDEWLEQRNFGGGDEEDRPRDGA
jgi:hypothetical protein